MRSCSVTVRGLVQGVFFRASAKKEADALHLSGFVRNQPDGSVYIEVQGEGEMLLKFLEWCRRGPAHARVEQCVISEIPSQNFRGFEVRWT